jgi:peptidoglycan/xylan/chitin deacetylase (PgdA/CDA1 family)
MSGIWPGDTQLVALRTFDVDGVSSWLNRNPGFNDHPSLMSMAECGLSVAVPRILDLLDGRSIKASFFVPGYVAETHPGLVEEIVRRGHDVGHHCYMHEPAASLSAEEETQVLEKSTAILQGITGQAPLGYRSPSWDLSTCSLGLLASHGFLYDSSMFGDDAPYLVNTGPAGESMVEILVSWLLDDAPNFVYAPVAGRLGPICATPTRSTGPSPPSSTVCTATGGPST